MNHTEGTQVHITRLVQDEPLETYQDVSSVIIAWNKIYFGTNMPQDKITFKLLDSGGAMHQCD